MYTREVTPGPEKIIVKHKPVFGTFNTLPDQLDIHGVKAPFAGIPLPPVLTKFRIRARLIYVFRVGDFLGSIDIFDNKIVNMAEVSLWNYKKDYKYTYRIFLGLRLRLIPKKLSEAVCVSSGPKRSIRIAWNHLKDRMTFKLHLSGYNTRPKLDLSFFSNFTDSSSHEIFSVKPAPTFSRCSATWYVANAFKGRLALTDKGGKEFDCTNGENGFGFTFMNRSYYKFITTGENITAIGKIKDKQVSFRFSTASFDAVDRDSYNDNVMFVDDQFSPMPPVDITHSFGVTNKWVIQDTESMIDLTFTPKSITSRNMNFVAVRTTYYTIFGTIDGILLDKDGNRLVLRDFPAISRSSKLRL